MIRNWYGLRRMMGGAKCDHLALLCFTARWFAHSAWLWRKTCRPIATYEHLTWNISKSDMIRRWHGCAEWWVGQRCDHLACYASQSDGLHTLHDCRGKTCRRISAHHIWVSDMECFKVRHDTHCAAWWVGPNVWPPSMLCFTVRWLAHSTTCSATQDV